MPWVVFPSANHDRAVTAAGRWKERGYNVAVWLDPGADTVGAHWHVWGQYPGWYTSCNVMAYHIWHMDPRSWVVAAGDDMDPDPERNAHHIERECWAHFPDGYGVMQPIGDVVAMPGTDKICGSPWFGPEWIRSAYEGMGPMPNWYVQFYGDEELLNVARSQAVLWQRMDLTQVHHHWCRPKAGIKQTEYQSANSDRYWKKDKATFDARAAAGWPQSGRK